MNFVCQLGYRLGKGGGYADLEYAMMRNLGFIDENTPVITTVHDCQIVDIPDELMEDHDFDVCKINSISRNFTFVFIYCGIEIWCRPCPERLSIECKHLTCT